MIHARPARRAGTVHSRLHARFVERRRRLVLTGPEEASCSTQGSSSGSCSAGRALQSRTARWTVLALAATGAATAAGLLLTAHGGLFGYTESLSAPYATLSLAVEFTAAFVLLLATAVLALSAPARAAAGPAPVLLRS